MGKLENKLKAFTLVESSAAMLIIAISFSAVMVSFGFMLDHFQHPLFYKALLRVSATRQEGIETEKLTEDTEQFDEMSVISSLTNSELHEGMMIYSVEAFDQDDRSIYVEKSLLRKPDK